MQRSISKKSLLFEVITSDKSAIHDKNLFDSINSNDNSLEHILTSYLGDFYISNSHLEIKEPVGEGGFATVHRCIYHNPNTNEDEIVALKKLKPYCIRNEEDLIEFLKEANINRKLKHENIVKILGIGASDVSNFDTFRETAYILQEYMEDGNMKSKIIKQMTNYNLKIYTLENSIDWLIQLSDAFYYLHSICRPSIIHRDLKLENILLTDQSRIVKICDFGLHKRLNKQSALKGNNLERTDSYYGNNLYSSYLAKDMKENETYSYNMTIDVKNATQEKTFGNKSKKILGTHKVGSTIYMAPEIINGTEYNEKVDVFSFGVTMYELFSRKCIIVYYGILGSASEIEEYSERVANGHREVIPSFWPSEMRNLVSDCWNEDPKKRPSFYQISLKLKEIKDKHISEYIKKIEKSKSKCSPIFDCGCSIQ